jgi:hypothetical protein
MIRAVAERFLMITLTLSQKDEYINVHLFNELRWLLNAATEWSIQDQLELNICGYDMQVYAMDSAFVHARALFEFFLQSPNENYRRAFDFIGEKLTSPCYHANWSDPLQAHLMHLGDRSKPGPLKTAAGDEKDLNEMPVEFANEVFRLWMEFERKLEARDRELGELAREKRKQAIKSAECVEHSAVANQHAKDKHKVLRPVFVFTG